MKTFIEPGQLTYHSKFIPLFRAFGDYFEQFRWLLTSCECEWYSDDFKYVPKPGRRSGPAMRPRLMSGAELRRVAAAPRVDFDWGVFTGFDPSTPVDLNHLAVEPWVEFNPAIFDPSRGTQYPGAAVEVVFWDSTHMIVTSDDEDLHRRLRAYFPEARPMPPLPTTK